MKKSLLILIPIIFTAIYLSRPASSPANEQISTPPIEEQTPAEEKIEEVTLTVSPKAVIQGEPVEVTINGLTSTTTIRALTFQRDKLKVYVEEGKVRALIGLDLKLPPASYPLTLTLTDGRVVQKQVVVGERVIAKAPLGIPEKLGGNTSASEQQLVSTLVEEGKIINAIETSEEKLWKGEFRFPLSWPIVITDTYGYSRQTGGSSISHKGTDFRAKIGTPIYAMNSGLVRFTRNMRNYGNTVAIDHGAGVLTIYMHLSELAVAEGQRVEKGDLIGRSGDTGYVLGPHLHLTIRVNSISIDPMKFMSLLGEELGR